MWLLWQDRHLSPILPSFAWLHSIRCRHSKRIFRSNWSMSVIIPDGLWWDFWALIWSIGVGSFSPSLASNISHVAHMLQFHQVSPVVTQIQSPWVWEWFVRLETQGIWFYCCWCPTALHRAVVYSQSNPFRMGYHKIGPCSLLLTEMIGHQMLTVPMKPKSEKERSKVCD